MAKKEKKQKTDSTLEILSVDEYLKLEGRSVCLH